MITEHEIESAARAIGEAAQSPAKVILFGSRARGDGKPDSDLDFLVIEERVPSDRLEEKVRLRDAAGRLPVGVDLIVMSREEAAYWSQAAGHTVRHAMREGKVLYDAE